MGEVSLPVLLHVIVFLLFPFIGGYIANRFKIPAIAGYIVSGIILGSLFRGTVSEEFLHQFAALGLVLLLFTVGLEVNIKNIARFGKFTLLGGLIQIGATSFFLFLLSLAFRMSFIEALLIGFSFSLSSTAIVTKLLGDRGEDNSLLSDLAVGLLVFQDVAAIPLIIMASTLEPNLGLGALFNRSLIGVARAAIVLGAMYLFGTQFVPLFFSKMAKASREVLNMATVLFILLAVALFSYLGLSASIAAFIAGLLVGQTLQHYHIFSQMRPLRDLFVVLFFVSLGAQVNVFSVLPQLPAIILFTILLTIIKFAVVLILFIKFKFHSRTSFSLGILLSQVGEFAFILLGVGLVRGALSESTYNFAITSTLLTILISPFLIAKREVIYTRIKKFIKKNLPDVENYLELAVDREPPHIDALQIKNHVIICGYGRVGKYVGRALSMADIPYVAIDYNYAVVDKARSSSITIIYGDPTDIDILDYAQAEYASCIISALPNSIHQEMVILNAKRLNPKIVVFTRVGREDDQQRMKDLGAEIVVQPEFEAALSITRKVYRAFNVSKEDMVGKIKRLKMEHGMA